MWTLRFPPAAGAAVAVLMVSAGAAHAYDWIEPRDNDAGKVIPAAQIPMGVGPLESISGSLDEQLFPGGGSLFGGSGGVPDGQDLYLINIVNPSAFTARTVLFGVSDFDTQLVLFSATGFGLLANDNVDSGTQFSRLLPMANDGTGFAVTVPGLYVLGIAGSGNFPIAASGLPLFDLPSPVEISGPDGAGAGMQHFDWAGPVAIGRYRIELTGVESAPAPGAAFVLGMGGLALGIRRRR